MMSSGIQIETMKLGDVLSLSRSREGRMFLQDQVAEIESLAGRIRAALRQMQEPAKMEWMSDAALIAARDHARKMAHDAPKNLFRNADGSDSLGNSDAWARWSKEWARLAAECDRRSLK